MPVVTSYFRDSSSICSHNLVFDILTLNFKGQDRRAKQTMAARNGRGFQNSFPLQNKRTPRNPKFANVKSRVNTGASTSRRDEQEQYMASSKSIRLHLLLHY